MDRMRTLESEGYRRLSQDGRLLIQPPSPPARQQRRLQHDDDDDAVSVRFWLGFSCVVFCMVHSGYFGGLTSPVLAANCGTGSASGGVDTNDERNSSSSDDVPCPECLNCQLHLSVQLQGMLSAAPSLLGIPASLVGGVAVDRFGRRRVLNLASCGVVLGWVLFFTVPVPNVVDQRMLESDSIWSQATSHTGLLLLSGRAIGAMFANIIVCAGSVWVAEVCPPAIRGSVMTTISLGWNFGALAVVRTSSMAFD
jgi:MFS family permease